MNPNQARTGGGSQALGYLLAVLIALVSPVALVLELMSLMPVLLLSSVAIVYLFGRYGRGPMLCCTLLQMLTHGYFLGSPMIWICMIAMVMPAFAVSREAAANRPFADQMRASLLRYVFGLVLGVFLLYNYYGGNFIANTITALKEQMLSVPQEYIVPALEPLKMVYGSEVTPEVIRQLIADAYDAVMPVYTLQLPGLLFSGVLATAVIAVTLANYQNVKKGKSAEGAYVPPREWYLKSSATWGILLMVLASYVLAFAGMKNAVTVNYAVLEVMITVFCVQALASLLRRLHASKFGKGARTALKVLLCIVLLSPSRDYLAMYGVLSAIFGSKGALRQRIERMNRNKDV